MDGWSSSCIDNDVGDGSWTVTGCTFFFNRVVNVVLVSFCVRWPSSEVNVWILSVASGPSLSSRWPGSPGFRTTFTAPSRSTVLGIVVKEVRTTLLTRWPFSSVYSSMSSPGSEGTSTSIFWTGKRRSDLVIVLVVVTLEILFTCRPSSSTYSSITSSGFTIFFTERCKGILTSLGSFSKKTGAADSNMRRCLPLSSTVLSWPSSP